MKKITLGKSDLQLPNIAVGCMRLNSLDKKGAADFINNALDKGANFFDHADIYGGGECEKLFSEAIFFIVGFFMNITMMNTVDVDMIIITIIMIMMLMKYSIA